MSVPSPATRRALVKVIVGTAATLSVARLPRHPGSPKSGTSTPSVGNNSHDQRAAAASAHYPLGPLWTHDYRTTVVTPYGASNWTGDSVGIIGTPVIDAPNSKLYLVTPRLKGFRPLALVAKGAVVLVIGSPAVGALRAR